jgi:hypothetical protein
MTLPMQATRFVWRRTGKRLIAAATAAARVSRNTVMRCLGRADYARWDSASGLEQWWDDRTRCVAALIPPGSRVIEFGAGRRSMEHFLPQGCTYTPSDLVDRGPGTLVCDLNDRPLPSLAAIKPQVAAFSGVLEYIRDVPGLVKWLAEQNISCCVASYDIVPAHRTAGLRWIRESWRRSHFGYMSSMTEQELVAAFRHLGFACTMRAGWTHQLIFRFERQA